MSVTGVRTFLFLVNTDWFFISHRLPIALELKKRGYRVVVAAPDTGSSEIIRGYGLEFEPLNISRRAGGLLSIFREIYLVIKLLRKIRPNVFHAITPKAVFLGGISSLFYTPDILVAAISGLGAGSYLGSGLLNRVRRKSLLLLYFPCAVNLRCKFIFQNLSDENQFKKFFGISKNRVFSSMGSGVDLDKYTSTPYPTDCFRVLFASRLIVEKGIVDFCSAARIFRENHPKINARFLIAGRFDSDNSGAITKEELFDLMDLNNTSYIGEIKDIPKLLQDVHLVTLPSFYGEGLPKILIEAAAAGRPVVTTSVPGCIDAVDSGKTGVIIAPRDPYALCLAIFDLYADPSKMNEMRYQCRMRAEKYFSIEKVIKMHLSVYGEAN